MPKPRKSFRIPTQKLFRLGLAAVFLVVLPRIITTLFSQEYLYTIEDVPSYEYAIVLAAEVKEDGSPSLVLQHRVERGVDLYTTGKAKKLIMSGKDLETVVMRDYAVSLGVPAANIQLDNGGIRTYATCYNAVNHFGLKDAIMVTQPYHMPRTLFLCHQLGLDAVGVPSIHGRYWRGSWVVWQVRETLATVLAFNEIYVSPPATGEYLTLAEEGDNHD